MTAQDFLDAPAQGASSAEAFLDEPDTTSAEAFLDAEPAAATPSNPASVAPVATTPPEPAPSKPAVNLSEKLIGMGTRVRDALHSLDDRTRDVLRRGAAGIAENTAMAAGGALYAAETLKPQFAETLAPARQFMRDVQERAKADYGVDPAHDNDFVSKVVAGASSLLPVVASGPAAPATAALLQAESTRQEAEAAGATEGQQQGTFALGAATGALSEALLGVPAMLRSARAANASDAAVKSLARKLVEQGVKSSGREATQEFIEQVSQNLAANTIVGYDPERPTLQGAGEAALIGGIVGGPAGAVTQAATEGDRFDDRYPTGKSVIDTLVVPEPAPQQPAPPPVVEPEPVPPVVEPAPEQEPVSPTPEPTTTPEGYHIKLRAIGEGDGPFRHLEKNGTFIGVNAAGEQLYDLPNGQRYRLRTDRKADHVTGKGGEPYADYGGDLAPVEPEATSSPESQLAETQQQPPTTAPQEKQVEEMTLAEFREKKFQDINKDYGIARDEFESSVTEEDTRSQFYEAVVAAANEGKTISEETLDSLDDVGRGFILKHFRGSVPEGYIIPSARHQSAFIEKPAPRLRSDSVRSEYVAPKPHKVTAPPKRETSRNPVTVRKQPKAKEPITPAKAVNVVKAELAKDKNLPGTPPTTKEFKTQISDNVQSEIENLVAEEKVELTPDEDDNLKLTVNGELEGYVSIEPQGGRFSIRLRGKTLPIKAASEEEAHLFAKAWVASGKGSTQIQIPGDGTFTLQRDGKGLLEVLRRVRGFSTPPKNQIETPTRASKDSGGSEPMSYSAQLVDRLGKEGALEDQRAQLKQLKAGSSAAKMVQQTIAEIEKHRESDESVQGAAPAPYGTLAPNTPSAPIVPVKSIREIIRDLSEGLGLPIRFGRLTTNKFAGYFKRVQDLIGAKRANDIEIVSHEVGHKLDALAGMSKLALLRRELDILGDPATRGSRSSWTKSKSLKYKYGEGVAEFVRYWLIDPHHAALAAPHVDRYFNLLLNTNPDFGDVMRQARQDIQNWRNAPAEARLDSSISIGGNPNKTRYTVTQLTRDVVDDLHILRLAVDDAERLASAKLPPSRNPYMLARLLRGSYGMADTFIRSGTVDFKTKKVTLGTSLTDALKPVSGRISEFRRWIIAKRAQELHARGKETGLVSADVDFTAAKYDKEATFQKAFTDLKAWSDSLLQYAVDSGYISTEHAAHMRALNNDYVPFARIFEIGAGEDPSQSGGGTGRGLNVGKVGSLRNLQGSPRDIVDPLETLVKNAYAIITASEKSAINGAIANLSSMPGMGKWVERIATPKESVRFQLDKIREQLDAAGADTTTLPDDLLLQFYQQSSSAPWGENIIKVSRSGNTTFYRLRSELFDVFHALDNEDSSRFIQILAAPAQWLRAGVTLTPDFALANLMRDTFSSAVINRYGMVPFEAAVRGMAAMVGNPTLVAEWSAAGGAQSIEANYFDRKKLSDFVRRKVTEDLTLAERSMIVVKSPLTALRWLTGALETVTRLGEYQRAYNEAVKGGMQPAEARRLAAFESRDRQDFAKGGAKTKPLRHAAAFWNAAVQANIKLAQAFKERPIRTTVQGLAFVTIPKLIEQALNWKDDDYWDRPQWERDVFFMIPAGKDNNGRTKFIRIPIPFEVGLIFGTLPGRMLQWAKTNRADATKGLAETVLRQTIPNPIPNSVQVVISDLMTGERGWDFFKMRPIVPESLAEVPAELQWTEQTSLTARHAGKLLGLSPLKIDHIIRNTTGGLGQQITHNVIDQTLSKITGEKATAMNMEPGMRFFSTPAGISSETVERFYTQIVQLRKAKGRTKLEGDIMDTGDASRLARMEAAADAMSALRKKARGATDQTEKQQYYLEIVDKARDAMAD